MAEGKQMSREKDDRGLIESGLLQTRNPGPEWGREMRESCSGVGLPTLGFTTWGPEESLKTETPP